MAKLLRRAIRRAIMLPSGDASSLSDSLPINIRASFSQCEALAFSYSADNQMGQSSILPIQQGLSDTRFEMVKIDGRDHCAASDNRFSNSCKRFPGPDLIQMRGLIS